MNQIENQQQVWDAIAPEWYKFKKTNDKEVIAFLKDSEGNLLDLGCGSGRYFIKTNATIYALDFSDEMLKLARKKAKQLRIKAELIQHDLSKKLPFEDNFFNNIICIATLHCIKGKTKRQNILKELYRISKPKAKLLIKVWNRKNKKFKNKGKEKLVKWRDKGARYYYFYTREELENELKKARFKILKAESQKNGFELQEIVILARK